MLTYGSNNEVLNRVLYYLAFAYVTIYPVTICIFLLIAG